MEKRVLNYKYAMDNYSHFLHNEFNTAAQFLNLKSGDTFVNFAAGGIPMEKYIPSQTIYLPIEINEHFSRIYNYPLCTYNNLPFEHSSIDKILVLASFHHFTEQERIAFYKESIRILKNNGTLVISDVIKDSLQDKWLNGFVNQYNSLGHSGIFMNEKDIDLMKQSGFNNVIYNEVEYTWDFSNVSEMIDFTKHLFNLDLADDKTILNGIRFYFGEGLNFSWKLAYFLLYP
jgi:predicted SAM-dependent methyltransferase